MLISAKIQPLKSGLFWFIFMGFCASCLAASAPSQAKIKSFEGKLEYQKAGTSTWLPADQNTILSEGDKLKSAENSTAILEFFGERKTGTVTVREKTEFTMATFNYGPGTEKENTLLDVAVGGILIQAEKLKGDSKFEVKTPASMVGIRGTTFNVQVSEE